MLLVGVCCLFMFVIWGFCGAIFFVIKHVSITDAEPFPEWNQKDIDKFQKLTGIKLPDNTVLLGYFYCNERGRHDIRWLIFSKEKITFPWELTRDIMPVEWEKDTFIEQSQIRESQYSLSKNDIVQSCLSSFKTYDGKGSDIFTEMKTPNGYYVRIQYCRILPRNSKEQKNAESRE